MEAPREEALELSGRAFNDLKDRIGRRLVRKGERDAEGPLSFCPTVSAQEVGILPSIVGKHPIRTIAPIRTMAKKMGGGTDASRDYEYAGWEYVRHLTDELLEELYTEPETLAL